MEIKEQAAYFHQSGDPDLCRSLYREAMDYYAKSNVQLEIHQEKSLLNHMAEMVKRNKRKEQLNIEDTTVFNELSQASLNKAKDIVNQLNNISADEVYLLAIHFEVANYN